MKFTYVQVDLATVGSQLESGALDAMSIYTASESAPPPWLAEASLAADWAALNPSAAELVEMKKKGLAVTEVTPKVFNRDTHTDKVIEMPFYYGFDVGLEVPEADVYKMLTIIEKNGADLAKIDPTFSQVRPEEDGGVPEARRRIVMGPRADPSGAGEMDAREGRLGCEVGFQGRQDVAADTWARWSLGAHHECE